VARNNEEAIPIHIRTFGIDLDRDARALMRGRITRKLRKFAASIERLSAERGRGSRLPVERGT
jgi:hypothetical protein